LFVTLWSGLLSILMQLPFYHLCWSMSLLGGCWRSSIGPQLRELRPTRDSRVLGEECHIYMLSSLILFSSMWSYSSLKHSATIDNRMWGHITKGV
jgi:hypothetical protein